MVAFCGSANGTVVLACSDGGIPGMSSGTMHEIVETIEADVQSRPSPFEFEMAYQARVAIDRIKFAIKHTEQFAPHTDTMREAGLQLLDALERLETVDRRFQQRSRKTALRSTRTDAQFNGNGRAVALDR